MIAARASGMQPAKASFVKPPPVAQRMLKTLQWEKVTAVALGSTVWDSAPADGASDLETKLRAQGIFDQMEEDFKAKQTVKMTGKKHAQTLESVLSVKERQRIGGLSPLAVRAIRADSASITHRDRYSTTSSRCHRCGRPLFTSHGRQAAHPSLRRRLERECPQRNLGALARAEERAWSYNRRRFTC